LEGNHSAALYKDIGLQDKVHMKYTFPKVFQYLLRNGQ
jgi:hypothetical protein